MQIGQLNHLKYPKGSELPLPTSAGDGSATAAEGSAKRGLGAAVRQTTPAQDAPGVVLKLQSGTSAAQGLALARGLVYSDGRKTVGASQADAVSETERNALQHSQALQRSATASTNLSVDKDGVLVALPAVDAEVKARDKDKAQSPEAFVHHAVSAMREYADEQERLKTAGRSADSASQAGLIPRGLDQVQKLAARFNLFA